MATAIQIISRALRLCRVLDAAQAAPADDTQDALAALNNIGQRWLASGLLAAWTDATGPTFTLVSPASANEALAYELARRIAPEYGKELPPTALEQGAEEKRLLWRDRLAAADTTINGVILRALRIVMVPGVNPDAVGFTSSLATLNAMLAEWHEAGIGMPDYSVTGLADTLGSDVADREAIAYQLALRLAPEYGAQLSADVHQQAMQSMFRLRSRYFQASHPIVGSYF